MPALTDYLAAARDALRGADAGVRRGDDAAVHDMRVAVRRLRATLRTFEPLLAAGSAEPLRDDLRRLGELLGAVRDGDVLAARLATAIAAEMPELIVGPVAARIRQRLAALQAPARAELAAALDSSWLANLLAALDTLIDSQRPEATDPRLRRLAARAVRRADRRFTMARQYQAGAVRASSATKRDAALHEARKAYKRARYAVEVLRSSAGTDARRLVRRLTALQDVLGGYQDAVVTAGLLRDYGMRAYLDGENAFTYGVLLARQNAAAEKELSSLERARRRAGRHRVRDWLG